MMMKRRKSLLILWRSVHLYCNITSLKLHIHF
jgi:hypothetical protein